MKNRCNVLFVHDHRFYKDPTGRLYSTGSFPAFVWQRYLTAFDSVSVLARNRTGKVDPTRLADSSHQDVEFHLMDNVSNLKSLLFGNRAVSKTISALVKESNGLIARLTSELGLWAIAEAKKQGKPYAIELVECPWEAFWNYGSIQGKIYAPIYINRLKNAMRGADRVLYVTQRHLQKKYPFHNGPSVGCSNVEIPPVSHQVLERRLQKITDCLNEKKIIGMIGSFSGKLKGFDVAFRALRRLADSGCEFEFRILGDGNRAWLRKLSRELDIGHAIFFDGTRPPGEPVFEWLDDLDLYIHPSKKEGLPRALIEAMSRALPAIASNAAGTPELLPASYICQVGDHQTLFKKIKRYIDNPDQLRKMSQTNFEKAKAYRTDVLDEKRTLFWKAYADTVRGRHA